MQKLSALNYIKNNKGRVSVLVVSLGLCFMLTYLTQFLLSTSEETMHPIVMENTRKIQYIGLAGSTLGLNHEDYEDEAFTKELEKRNLALAEKLKEKKEILEVYYAQIIYNEVKPVVGQMTVEIPCVEKDKVPIILKHFGAELLSGRLPENPGEIVLDEASMHNNDFELNGYFGNDIYGNYGNAFKIVGVLDCKEYFGCGIPSDKYEYDSMLTVLSDGSIDDMTAILQSIGIDVRENYDTIVDYESGKEFLENNVINVIGNSTKYIYAGIMMLLSISMFIVYTMYLRNRHNEWCLYCSIGYSRKAIYISIMKELLFTFGTAILAGGILIAAAILLLDCTFIRSQGIRCRYFYPGCIGEILCSYVLLLGILQLPVRYALYKIRTIDTIEDDLY